MAASEDLALIDHDSGVVRIAQHPVQLASRQRLRRRPIVDGIRGLNQDVNWRRLFGEPSPRLKDHELILRALAMGTVIDLMHDDWADLGARRSAYRPPMSEFLNSYLQTNRDLAGIDTNAIEKAFAEATELLMKTAGRDALRFNGRLNAAHVDAVMSTLMKLSMTSRIPDTIQLAEGLAELRESELYIESVTRSTSHRESVYGRLEIAQRAFNPS